MTRLTRLPLLILTAVLAAAMASPPGAWANLLTAPVTVNVNVDLAPKGHYTVVYNGPGTPVTTSFADEADYGDVTFHYCVEAYLNSDPDNPVETKEGTFDPLAGAFPVALTLAKGNDYSLRTRIWTVEGDLKPFYALDGTLLYTNVSYDDPQDVSHHAKICAYDQTATGVISGAKTVNVTPKPLTAEVRVVATDQPSCDYHTAGYSNASISLETVYGLGYVPSEYDLATGEMEAFDGPKWCVSRPAVCGDGNTLLCTERIFSPDKQTPMMASIYMDDVSVKNISIPVRQGYRTTVYGDFHSLCDHEIPPSPMPELAVSMDLDSIYDVYDMPIGDGSAADRDASPTHAGGMYTAIFTRRLKADIAQNENGPRLGEEIMDNVTIDGSRTGATFALKTLPLPEGRTHDDYLYNGLLFATNSYDFYRLKPSEGHPGLYEVDYRPHDDRNGYSDLHSWHAVEYFEATFSPESNSFTAVKPGRGSAGMAGLNTPEQCYISGSEYYLECNPRIHSMRVQCNLPLTVTYPSQIDTQGQMPLWYDVELGTNRTNLGYYLLPGNVFGSGRGITLQFFDRKGRLLDSLLVTGENIPDDGRHKVVNIHGDIFRQAGLRPEPVITADDLTGKVAGCVIHRADFGDREFNNTHARFEPNGAPNKVKLTGLRWRPLHYYSNLTDYSQETFPLTFTIVGDELVLDYDILDGMMCHHATLGDEERYYFCLGDTVQIDKNEHNAMLWPCWKKAKYGDRNIGRYDAWIGKITVGRDGVTNIDFNEPEHALAWTRSLTEFENEVTKFFVDLDPYAEAGFGGHSGGGFITRLNMNVYEPNTTFTGKAYPGRRPVATPGIVKLGMQADGHNLHMLNMCGEGWPMMQPDSTRHWVYGDIDFDRHELRIPRQALQPFPRHYGGSNSVTLPGDMITWAISWNDVIEDPVSTTAFLQSASGGDIVGREEPYYAHDNHNAEVPDEVAQHLWDANQGGTLNTQFYHRITFPEPWTTVTGYGRDDVPYNVEMDDWYLLPEPATAAMDNQILDYGYSATGGLYVKGIVRLGANADLVDHIEVYAMPDVTTSIDAYDDMLSQADGIAGALNISAYPTDFNMEQSGAPLLYPDADGNILYNQHARPEYVEQPTASAPRRAASNGGFSHFADRVPGHTVYVKTIYKEDTGLAPTFHAMAAKDAVTTSVDDIPWAQPVTQVTIGRGQVTVSGTDAVTIHNVSGQQVYSGAAGTVSLPSGIYLVQGRGLRPAKAVVR